MVDKQSLANIREMGEDDWRDICTVILEEVIRKAGLTPREAEIAMLLLMGLEGAVIAKHLGIAEKTLKQHIHKIYRTFGAAKRVEFVCSVFPIHGIDVPPAPKKKRGYGWRAGQPGRREPV